MRIMLLIVFVIGFLAESASRSYAQETPKALVEKSIKAHGGEQNLAKLKAASIKSRSTISAGAEISLTTVTVYQLPGQLKKIEEMELAGNKVTVITVINGNKGWINVKGQTTELDARLLTEAKEGIHLIRLMILTPLLDKSYHLSPLGEMKVNGRPALGVKAAAAGFRDVLVYFDKQTGLIAKLERRSNLAGKEVKMEITCLEYGEYDGVQYPKKSVLHADGKKFQEIETTEVKFLDKVAANTFAKP